LVAANRDKKMPLQAGVSSGGYAFMESIRPDNTDPIPLRTSPHSMGTLMIRFVGLLIAAVAVMALIWSR